MPTCLGVAFPHCFGRHPVSAGVSSGFHWQTACSPPSSKAGVPYGQHMADCTLLMLHWVDAGVVSAHVVWQLGRDANWGAWVPWAPLPVHWFTVASAMLVVHKPFHHCLYKFFACCHNLPIYYLLFLYHPEHVYDFGIQQMFISFRGDSHMLIGNGISMLTIISDFEKSVSTSKRMVLVEKLIFFKNNIYLFIYLVAPGLSCGSQAP